MLTVVYIFIIVIGVLVAVYMVLSTPPEWYWSLLHRSMNPQSPNTDCVSFEFFDEVCLKVDPQGTKGLVIAIIFRPGGWMVQVQWGINSVDNHYPQELQLWGKGVFA